jgi:hypothetical protein
MHHCQELTCFINLGDHVMEAINWKINYEYMKFQANDVHWGKSKIYITNNVYVQYTCNLLFLCRSLQHIKKWYIINNIVQI